MPWNRKTPYGFTLLELLVALTLTSALVMVIYGSLRITLKAMARSQATAEYLQEIRMGQAILDRSISSIIPGSAGRRNYFLGNSQEMRFFTLVPLEAYTPGGVYHWRLLVGQDEAGQKVLAVEQTKNVNWQRDPEGVEIRQIIMQHITSAQFSFGRGDAEITAWDAEKEGKLPSWVRIQINPRGLKPLVFLIPIHTAEGFDATTQLFR